MKTTSLIFLLTALFSFHTSYLAANEYINKNHLEITGGFSTNIQYTNIQQDEYSSYFNRNFPTESSTLTIETDLLFTCSYFFTYNFSLGLSTALGYNLVFHDTFKALFHNINSYIRVVNKIGKRQSHAIIEYGVKITGRYLDDDVLYNYFFIGPALFAGYEKRIGKHFLVTIGSSFDISFYKEKTITSPYTYNEYFITNISTGLEIRFSFRRTLKIKK